MLGQPDQPGSREPHKAGVDGAVHAGAQCVLYNFHLSLCFFVCLLVSLFCGLSKKASENSANRVSSGLEHTKTMTPWTACHRCFHGQGGKNTPFHTLKNYSKLF